MPSLQDLIKQYPLLGEHLAEIENRISFLENSQCNIPVTQESEVVTEPEPQWSKRQWDYVKQLKSRVIHFEGKVEELMGTLKKKKGTPKDIYMFNSIKSEEPDGKPTPEEGKVETKKPATFPQRNATRNIGNESNGGNQVG